jgi:hypothetical protein
MLEVTKIIRRGLCSQPKTLEGRWESDDESVDV